ncbi:MAG: hypothetical protein AABY46_04435 [Nitrospirota bacterium]
MEAINLAWEKGEQGNKGKGFFLAFVSRATDPSALRQDFPR